MMQYYSTRTLCYDSHSLYSHGTPTTSKPSHQALYDSYLSHPVTNPSPPTFSQPS